MVLIEQFDTASLSELNQRTDELGVLSVYVNADHAHDPNLRAAGIDVRNRFRELQHRVSADDGSPRSREVLAALERLWPRVETLTSPAVWGRGRIMFAALAGDWTTQLESAMPVTPRLVLDSGPFIHPLLELLDEGRPAGVVVLTAEQARLLEWRAGSMRELSQLEQEYRQAPHERAGHVGGGPAGQYNSPVREQRQARERDRSERFLHHAAGVVTNLADEHDWDQIFVVGAERWIETIVAKFPPAIQDKAVLEPQVLTGVADAALAGMVTGWVHAQHKDRENNLLTRVRDAAGTGAGALGLSQVTAALNDGRVAHLVYDPAVRYAGSVGADGALYGGDESPRDTQVRPEPRLNERLVERALETGARITPIEGAAHGTLTEAAGVGALLRW